MKRSLFLIALSACASPPPPVAYTPVPRAPVEFRAETLTLDRAIELAERTHPDLAASAARIEAAEGRREQAGTFPNPKAVARYESAPADDAELIGGVSLTLPVGGRLAAAERVEAAERDRAAYALDAHRREVRAGVQGSFAAALYADRVVALQTETLAAAESAVRVVQAREAAGDAVPAEVARVEMEAARVRVQSVKARTLRERAILALVESIGDAGLQVEGVEGDLEATLALPELESIVARVEAATAAADADVRVQEATIEWVEAQIVPDVNLDLFYRRIDGSEDGFDVGVGIEIPLFDRREGRLREARADLDAARARLRAARTGLSVRLRDAHARLAQSLETVALYRDEIVPRVATVLKAAEARYEAGDESLSDVLPVRREAAAIRLEHLESLRDAREAWAEVEGFAR